MWLVTDKFGLLTVLLSELLIFLITEHKKFPSYSWTYTPSNEEQQKGEEESDKNSPKAKL